MSEGVTARPVVAKPVRSSGAELAVTVSIPLLTLGDLLLQWRWSLWGAALMAGVFVACQRRHMTPPVQRTVLFLLVVTGLLLPLLPEPGAALERGLRIGVLIASLLVSTKLVSRAIGRVPRTRALLDSLHRVAPSHRYGVQSVASQFFGGLLGLAGVTMMMESAAQQKDLSHKDRLASFSAITRGYAALSLWSPMYSNMSITLALYQGAQWVSVLPAALLVAAFFLVLGTALERLSGRARQAPGFGQAASFASLLHQGWPVLLGMCVFVVVMVLASRGLALPISAVIIAGAPLAAWLLNAHMGGSLRPRFRGAAGLMAADLSDFRIMAGEVAIFMASGCAGTVIGSAIPKAWIAAIGAAVAGSPELACLTVSATIVALSAGALHPMLSAIIVGSSLGPAQLGLPMLPHLSAVLVGWGLAIIVTPFSVISGMASRWSGLPLLTISLRANAVFVLLALGGSAGLLGLMARAIAR